MTYPVPTAACNQLANLAFSFVQCEGARKAAHPREESSSRLKHIFLRMTKDRPPAFEGSGWKHLWHKFVDICTGHRKSYDRKENYSAILGLVRGLKPTDLLLLKHSDAIPSIERMLETVETKAFPNTRLSDDNDDALELFRGLERAADNLHQPQPPQPQPPPPVVQAALTLAARPPSLAVPLLSTRRRSMDSVQPPPPDVLSQSTRRRSMASVRLSADEVSRMGNAAAYMGRGMVVWYGLLEHPGIEGAIDLGHGLIGLAAGDPRAALFLGRAAARLALPAALIVGGFAMERCAAWVGQRLPVWNGGEPS